MWCYFNEFLIGRCLQIYSFLTFQKQAILEIGVNNPTNHELTLEAEIKGEGLSGPAEIQIKPKARALFEVVYAPAVVGKYNGR